MASLKSNGKSPLVGIVMGSHSDLPVMKAAAEKLESFGVPYEISIVSAHRTPQRMVRYAEEAKDRGLKVIIAGAGGAAHVAGMVAALTPLPVIAVPIKTPTLNGLDSLLSMVQMPDGIPVATVAINGAGNAGLLALRILGLSSEGVADKIMKHKAEMKSKVESKARELETQGYKNFLSKHQLS